MMHKQKESWKLYYESLNEFNHQYYGGLLSEEHLTQFSQVHFTKFFIPGDTVPYEADFWGYHLIKDGINYLIKSSDNEGNEIDIRTLLPIEAHDLLKVADSKGNVYLQVNRPIPKRIEPKKVFTPKEFVDNLCLLNHTNPKALKLMTFMGLSQLWDRSYYRIASIPGFGKDGVADVLGHLFGNCATIESPTIAKLEDRATVLKWLIVNEVVDIQKADWDIIQQFLLSAGARKNKITKHSRAFKNVMEIIDVSKFSLSLYYNDVDCYPDAKNVFKPYFDDITKKAVRDRFPAFRFHGGFDENFNSMSRTNVSRLVENNTDWYVSMIQTFTYYKHNFHTFIHNWNDDKLLTMKGRDVTNLGVLLKVVDMYCDTQAEFDEWLVYINESMMDYVEMLGYPKAYKKLLSYHEKIEKNLSGKALTQARKEHSDTINIMQNINLFKDKCSYIYRMIKGTSKEDSKLDTKGIYAFGVLDKTEDEIL